MRDNIRTLRRKLVNRYTLLMVVVLISAGWSWTRHVSPTRVAVVNFTDVHFAQMLDAKDNAFVRLERLVPEDLNSADLSEYAATLVFGMGLHLTEGQRESMREGMSRGARVFVAAHTSRESDLTNIAEEDLDHLNAYSKNAGQKNTQRLFNYIRRVMDGKRVFSDPVEAAEIVPMDALFHLARDTFYETVEEYQKFYEERHHYKQDRPRVCLLTSIVGPRLMSRSYVDGLIERLEARDMNVYPVAGFLNRLNFLKEIKPDIVLYIPHGRLAMGQPDEAVRWLKERNVPMLCPLDVHQPHDEWVTSQQGLIGGMLSQSIVVPEIDGCIEPFVIGAQFPDERGLNISGGIPERVDRMVSRVEKWLALKTKPNGEKRVAIFYYKGPGRNAMVAAGLEVAPSLLGLLRHLRDAGYQTGPLPETPQAFMERIQQEGPVLGPYAKGAFADFVETGDPELIPVETYLDWVRRQIDPKLYAEVETAYGPAPGSYLSTAKDGKSYLALPRVRFGNVVLVPQPLPGLGDDTNKLVHGVKKAPPHPYLAAYLWVAHGFQADALMHFGTHGSFEFTPWKQSALSRFDWSDALIGDLPHPYLYVINNIGEAIIAKRRSYAEIVSHVTPPFVESELYGPLMKLDHAVDGYRNTEDERLRVEFAADICSGMLELNLHKDLGFDDFDGQQLIQQMVNALHNYLHTLAQEKITHGLYTIGTPYIPDHSRETARLMAVDPISYSLAHLDEAKGKVSREELEELHDFSDTYRKQALTMIDQILAGEAQAEELIAADDVERLKAWDKAHAKEDEGKKLAAMMAMRKSAKGSGGEQAKKRAARVDQALDDAHKGVVFKTEDLAGLRESVQRWSENETTVFFEVCDFFGENMDLAADIEARGGDDAERLAAILRLGKGHLEAAIKIVQKRHDAIEEQEREYVEAVRDVRDTLNDVARYETALGESTRSELAGVVRALGGGYLSPSTGGDPIGNPNAVPTGRNLYGINMEKCPSPQAWRVGVQLADSIIRNKREKTGAYPKKVAITLWGGEMIRSEGAELATIFHLLGVEPERNSRGTVHAVRLVPMEELGRPRIDVVVQTSGQARDIAASRLFLIDEAVKLAAKADDPPDVVNNVKEGTLRAERVMKDRGLSPLDARTFATARVFGGANGNYGTAIMGLVESGDRWESDKEISQQYLQNMGAVYTRDHWGHFESGIFEAALQNTDTLAHNRSSNTWGPLSLDHVYEFMGGLNATIRNVTGNDPDAYFADLRNRHNPVVQGVEEAIWTENRTTLMNPKYIAALQEGGASSAEEFAETFRNTYGWNVMKPAAIDAELWEGLYDVYIQDKYKMNLEGYFRDKNPFALQEMTAVMLETIRKGYWSADQDVIAKLAGLHAELVRDHKPGCSGFVCDNAKLREMIAAQLSEEMRRVYNDALDDVRIGEAQAPVKGMTLERETNTLDEMKRIVADNMSAILALLVLVGLVVLVVVLGARRRKSR